ncbi:MAG: methyl-accepting chemotaxis protein [Selenomonadaceae bacterium]|jgi:methyl-accepting chemotaxis protein|uniref:methyl-accepting chemotaxis protein n=1 Tax=Selenomonas bovis TaxID=416586 RepID=UPI0004E287FD|nr:methyl-accepting chemotaxis protein [Selenomonas bovis]MDY6272105.1 methyl-accepting chemotaxis protein [Selenomonadaceae bacterium]MDY6298842.1 methyl-accepting chemotaxis protein [Selenomonadaceae bacterium]
MQFNSLKTKFLVALLPLFIGSFIVFFAVSYYMSSSALKSDADDMAKRTGQVAALQIEEKFQRSVMTVKGLVHNKAIIHGDRVQREAALAAMKEKEGGDFAMFAFSDVDGHAFSDKGVDMDRTTRGYIKQVRETKQPCITGPSVSGTSGKLITIIAYPVLDEQEQLVGIVYGTIELDSINSLVGDIEFFDTGRVYVADEDGLMVAYAQHPEDIGKMDLTQTETDGKTIDQKLVDGFKEAAGSKQQVVTQYRTSKGVDSLAVMTPVDLGYRHWVAVAVAPLTEVEASASTLMKTMLGLALLMLIIVSAVVIYISERLSKPVRTLRDECELINSGDLTKRPLCLDTTDELGALAHGFSDMRHTMRDLITSITKNAERVSASSEELTAAAQQTAEASTSVATSVVDIAEGIGKQSESISSTTVTVKKISEQTENVANNASAIAIVTEQTVEAVKHGQAAIQDIVTAMGDINDGTGTVQNTIAKLAKQSDEISKIVDVITGIAEQTNLLALNAAIEAARAGEAGRGFAVVADEVRKLAEESGASATKIAELVATIQTDMKEAVEASAQSSQSVEGSRQSVKEADEIFTSIQLQIEALAGGIQDVSNSIQTISEGTKSMTGEMDSIASISHENASRTQSVSATTEEQSASSEEIAASTRNLSQLAEDLQGEVHKFKV